MASEPAWSCVASSAFPLIYSYSKDLALGGRNSRTLEKDHAKLIQTLEQQLKLKGRSAANKVETLFFYSHFSFLTSNELELVLLRLSEQFHSTNQLTFRLTIFEMFQRLQVHFSLVLNCDTAKIAAPIVQVVNQHEDVATRIIALKILAVISPYIQDDIAVQQAVLSKLNAESTKESIAAVATAKEFAKKSSTFVQLLAVKLVNEPLELHLMPLIHLSSYSNEHAQEIWKKCIDFYNHGVYVQDGLSIASYRWTAPILRGLARLAPLVVPHGIPQLVDIFKRLLDPARVDAPCQRTIVSCLTDMIEVIPPHDVSKLIEFTQTSLQPTCSIDVDGDLLVFLEMATRHVLLEDFSFALNLFERQRHGSMVYAHVLYNQARHELKASKLDALQQLLHFVTVSSKLRKTAIRLIEGLATEFPTSVPAAIASPLCSALTQQSIPSKEELWVFLSHLATYTSLEGHSAALQSILQTPPTWMTHDTKLAIVVTLLRGCIEEVEQVLLQSVPNSMKDPWFMYQVGRECILHGKYSIARRLLNAENCSSERNGYWMEGLHAWASGEALLHETPTIVPPATLLSLNQAIHFIQAAATTNAPHATILSFLKLRLHFLTVLQSIFQFTLEIQIGGNHAPSSWKWIDAVEQFGSLHRQFLSLGNIAWSAADLSIITAHGHLCTLLIHFIESLVLSRPRSSIPVWQGTVAPFSYNFPLWKFCNTLDKHGESLLDEISGDKYVLMNELGQSALAVPCAVPRQCFRSTPSNIPCDIQISSGALKMMSRSVLGLSKHTDCQGNFQVAIDLDHVSRASPMWDTNHKWCLQFEGVLTVDGAKDHVFESAITFDPLPRNRIWYGILPFYIASANFGAQGTSCVLGGHLWAINYETKQRWAVATKALERTIVVY